MMIGRRQIARTARLLGRVARGLPAAVLLAALVAGVPWALIYGAGWPLPDDLPSLNEIGSVLMAPMSTRFLLDMLACMAWLLWLVFAVDVAACVVEVARGARWPELRQQTGPVRRVAAVLVGALLVAVLGRTATAAPVTSAHARPEGHVPVIATASASTTPIASEHTQMSQLSAEFGTERVRQPENGVHDSLWRIAQRCLGDGDRWPEIWALNEGSTQPGERILTNPNLIHPGDTLHIPTTDPVPVPSAPPPPPESTQTPPSPSAEPTLPAPPTTFMPPSSAPAPATAPAAQPTAPAADEPAGGAVTWGSGEVFVSLGLAAAASALLVLARRRRRSRYRPGSGRRDDDLPVAPVVYQLRLAHLRAQHHDEDLELEAETDDPATHEHRRREPVGSDPAPRSSTGTPEHADTGNEGQVRVLTSHLRRVIGAATPTGAGPATPPSVVDIALDATPHAAEGETTTAAADEGTQIALDLARVHGLGLVGPGGYAAARALLLTLLTTTPEDAPAPRVFVPAADLARLLGVPVPITGVPDTVTVVADLDSALASLDDPAPHRPAVLITAPPRESGQQAKLQHLLDNNAQHGLAALLLGQWRPGVTAYVTAAGVFSATDPGVGKPLRGTRAFTLPETATRDLLDLLHTAQPDDGGDGVVEDDALHGISPTSREAAVPPQVAAPSSHENTGGGPNRLEITRGALAPEPSQAKDGDPGAPPRSLPENADSATTAPLALTVFGAPALHWRPDPARPDTEPRDLSGELSSRPVELLVFLAVHPGGVSRDGIVDALWPDAPPRNPASVLRTVLSRIRRALDRATGHTVGELVVAEHGQYRLDAAVVEVDYWGFADAVTRRRTATTPERRTDAYEAIVARYGGPLAEGLDAEWLIAAREATRRDALDAVAALARARVEADPDCTLDLLETARAFDPHNELLYRDIMRLQHKLGRHDTISRTLTLLRTRLAEVDATPTADTIDLAQRLRAHDTGIPVDDFSRSTAR